MIGVQVKTENQTKRVAEAVERAAFKNLGHAAATIRRDAVESIVVAEGPSPPGTPPHTRRRQLKRAIRFDYDCRDRSAVVGPMASMVGESGAAHELGGEFRGEQYPQRPFMVPAMERNLDRFAGDWAGSIGD
jgi:phage gpG-like protein